MRYAVLPLVALLACAPKTAPEPAAEAEPEAAADDMTAEEFVAYANDELRAAWVARDSAYWTYETDITDAHAEAAAEADAQAMAVLTELIAQAAAYDTEGLEPEVARQIEILRMATALPAPSDADKRERLASISSELSGMYATGEVCDDEGDCRDLEELVELMANDRDYDANLGAWVGWRTISPPMKPLYAEFAALGNEGARDIGYSDMGELWRSGYDMPADEVPGVAEGLYEQVRPLYEQLHCYTRAELGEKYGDDAVPPDGPIPAHLTGNMWAQSWGNLYPMLQPYPEATGIDITGALQEQEYSARQMVEAAEGFFVGLGLDPLPDTFWERSMFTKPADREVQCHASAWDVTYDDDVRIKMCIEPTAEDFYTIHHELGHDYYFHYYHDLPVLFQAGAHDGFHEAIGDVISLSVTPGYLHEIGLAEVEANSDRAVVNEQMRIALDKVAFLPFGLLIDKWRWQVFDGTTPPETYNAAWWALREDLQGVAPPVPRSDAEHFDPGAKYHIPANTPYLRYFFSTILQFQIHEALCETAGHEGPLYTCSIHESEEAGARLRELLELGASQPWPDALEAATGQRAMSAEPMLEYFAPLQSWLEEQNEGRSCGW